MIILIIAGADQQENKRVREAERVRNLRKNSPTRVLSKFNVNRLLLKEPYYEEIL